MYLYSRFRNFTSGRFIRNVGWLGVAELGNRIFRLGTTITLARMFAPEEYGLMAVIYTTFDFAQVFVLNSGFNATIIQSDEQDLEAICNTSFWLNLLLCFAITLGQCAAAIPIANFYGSDRLILPICVAALVYLHYPFVVINYALISRRNQLKVIGMCQLAQSVISNIVTVVLVLAGMSIWAIVWAMLLSSPVWIIITWSYEKWRPPAISSFKLAKCREVIGFSGSILGVELLTKLRSNLDYLIIGRFLSVEALGLYYFAFNAGIGISSNVIKAFTNALYPHICEVKTNLTQLKSRYLGSLSKLFMVIIPFVILQSSLAPIYVPVVFGEQWSKPIAIGKESVSAIPILVIICLSAIPFALSFFTDSLLNAIGKPKLNLYFNLIYTLFFAGAILSVVDRGVIAVAIAVLTCHLILSSLFAFWSFRHVFMNN